MVGSPGRFPILGKRYWGASLSPRAGRIFPGFLFRSDSRYRYLPAGLSVARWTSCTPDGVLTKRFLAKRFLRW